MKKYIIVFALSITSFIQVFSQQKSLSNLYTQNLFTINPAATGIQGNFAGYLNVRDQWTGLKGAPAITSLGLHSMVNSNMGLGLNIEQNEVGVFKQFISEFNYSYRSLLSKEQSIAFGLKAGISKSSLNYQIMQVAQEDDITLYSSSTAIDEIQVRVGAGMHYNNKNFNAHISAPVLYGAQEKKFFQTVHGLASYDFYAAENIWKFQPSFLYRHTYASKGQAELNLMAEWDKKLWGLLSYRTNKSFIMGLGMYFGGLGLGYAYEVNGSELSSVASGSHEIMIYFETGFSFAKNKPHYKSSKRNLTR